MFKFLGKLLTSIFGSDVYILFCAVITGASIYAVLKIRDQVKEEISLCRQDPNKRFAADLSRRLNTGYNFFTTMITIFPLLGMLGTVRALIGLDLASGASQELQGHFFDALTSTAWGIIFAVIFKLINAFIEYSVICQIEDAEKILSGDLSGDSGEG